MVLHCRWMEKHPSRMLGGSQENGDLGWEQYHLCSCPDSALSSREKGSNGLECVGKRDEGSSDYTWGGGHRSAWEGTDTSHPLCLTPAVRTIFPKWRSDHVIASRKFFRDTLLPNTSTCQRCPQGPSPPHSGLPQLHVLPLQLTQPALSSWLSEGSPQCARPPPSLCVSCLFCLEGPPSSHPFWWNPTSFNILLEAFLYLTSSAQVGQASVLISVEWVWSWEVNLNLVTSLITCVFTGHLTTGKRGAF